MNIRELRNVMSEAYSKYNAKYMKWLDTQDITKIKPNAPYIPKPKQPVIEITKSDEMDLMCEDVGLHSLNWLTQSRPTLDGVEMYGVKIKVVE